jgi:hypothetical protein
MKVILGVTMRNEVEYGPHVRWQLDDALEMDYDHIVVLDDGSTDGTWEILQEYANQNKNVSVFRNEKNSILDDKGTNRWASLIGHIATFKPTWVNIRAADQHYSKFYKENMRKVLKYFLDKNAHIINFPLVHLWRSESWYRANSIWGDCPWSQNRKHVWRFNENYSYVGSKRDAVLHKGQHFPSKLGINGKVNHANVNAFFEDASLGKNGKHYPIMILHYGHTTHAKKAKKFELSMQQANHSVGMPGPKNMPMPNNWLRYNGYKGFYEFEIELKPCPKIWFGDDFEAGPKPKIESFFTTILKYNKRVAEQYKKMFEAKFGG